ncbi:chymotrypsin-like elastase family member 2A isoform X2 [Onthophagus taurus]|uniref:chymotrypsin-like elastase family member 2A isoform X2 n=1 Tax=Onthophagus taurus TaxID=166361 RepID=UPI0039BE60A1
MTNKINFNIFKVLLGVLCLFRGVFGQVLESPCPRLFIYEPRTESDRWHGIITLLSDSELSGIWLRIILDNPSEQLGNWFGEVVTDDNKEYLIKNRNHKLPVNTPYPLKFYIKYNPNGPIPRLVSFRLNAKTVCPEGGVTTTPPTTSGQLITSSSLSSTASPNRPPQPINRPSSPSNPPVGFIERPQVIQGGLDQSDDFFPGDFNYKPDFLDGNVECGTIAVAAQPLIVYGQKTSIGQFPWHAALYHSRGVGLQYVCGGSLVSRYHVITAAHCVTSIRSAQALRPDNMLIYLGKYYLNRWGSPGVQNHEVAKIIRHPKYNGKMYQNDVAVLKMASAAEFTDYVRPVCLWEGDLNINSVVGNLGSVVGWGFNEYGKLTEELIKLDMPIVSKDTCIYSFPDFYVRYTTSDTFCAGFTNGSTVCNGDSGGGMVFQRSAGSGRKVYQLRGVVSLSVALQNEFKCDPKHYVVFTDVAKYLDFIKNAMQQ